MAAIGFLMFLGATLRTEFVLYRLLEARARLLWKDQAHRFLQASGLIVFALGVLWATGVIWSA